MVNAAFFAENEMTEDRRTCYCCFLTTLIIYISCFAVYVIFVFRYFKKYYHGESIAVNVLVDNNTTKSVRKIKISGKS